MSYIVDFAEVSTIGLESSPVVAALAGLRANEARYFANKYEHVFTVESRGAAARCGSCGGALIPPSFQEGLGLPVCVRCASSRICPRLRYSPAPARPRPRVV